MSKFEDGQRVILTRDLGDDLQAGMTGVVHVVSHGFCGDGDFAPVIEFDSRIGWHVTRMLGMSRVLIADFCVAVRDEYPHDEDIIYHHNPDWCTWYMRSICPSPDFDPDGDISNPNLDDTQKIEVVTDDECGDVIEKWEAHPYETVSDDVIAQMQAKFPDFAYNYDQKRGALYIATKDFGDVKRGMVGKLYWSPSSPTSSDGILFTLPNGEKDWNRWVWEYVVPYVTDEIRG
jgi:hypothetical protein